MTWLLENPAICGCFFIDEHSSFPPLLRLSSELRLPKLDSVSHRRSQGSQRGHAPQIYGKYSHFVL